MSATFVLVPAAHLLVTENGAPSRRMAVAATIVLGSAFIAYFSIHKFIVLPHLTDAPYLGDYAFSFTPNIFFEAVRRITAYLGSGGYFWLCLDVAWFPKLIGLSAFVAFSYCVMLVVRRSITTTGLINVLMACCLFIVCCGAGAYYRKIHAGFSNHVYDDSD